jgi:hypothetical protein
LVQLGRIDADESDSFAAEPQRVSIDRDGIATKGYSRAHGLACLSGGGRKCSPPGSADLFKVGLRHPER